MTEIDVHHLAAAYALDALDDRERVAFEAHYGDCEVCRSDVLAFRDTIAHVATSLATPPPASLKSKVLAEVATTRQLSPLVPLVPPISLDARRRARRFMSLAAVAAAIVMIVVSVAALRKEEGGDDAFASDLARVMAQTDSQMLTLQNNSGTEGTFKVAWSNSLGEVVLMGENLPTAPHDHAYELWLITPDDSMAMYVLDPAADGNVHHTMKAPAEPSAWAITVEPEAGSPVATGDIIYISDVPSV